MLHRIISQFSVRPLQALDIRFNEWNQTSITFDIDDKDSLIRTCLWVGVANYIESSTMLQMVCDFLKRDASYCSQSFIFFLGSSQTVS